METEFAATLRKIIQEEVRLIVREEVRPIIREEVIPIIREEVRPIVHEEVNVALKPTGRRLTRLESRLDKLETRFDGLESQVVDLRADMHQGFRGIESRLAKQDEKLDTILEGWTIQKVHRRELDDHEERITAIEHRIPAIS